MAKPRQFRLLMILFVSLTIYFWSIIDRSSKKTTTDEVKRIVLNTDNMLDTYTSSYSPLPTGKQQSPRLVLLWTDLFDTHYWHQESFFNTSTVVFCSAKYQCRFTRNRNELSQTSLVAFHLYDINRHDLPERELWTYDNQTWVFITGESPINFYYQNPSFYPRMLDNYFDESISYKYDSPFSIFSASIQPRGSLSSDLTVSLHTKEMQLNAESLKKKMKPIVWIVSNCVTFSQREKYVEGLKKFIPIDIYGKCGETCSKGEHRECQVDLNQYYFYLAFENSRCNSYITEKFWNIITRNDHRLVPIVMGPRENDYARIAPKKSYIHVDTHQTPENLAQYLHDLIQNPKKYLLYLEWRTNTQIELISPNRWNHFLCPLCQMAYEPRRTPSTRLQFSSWFNPTTECHHNDVEIFRKCKQTNLNTWMGWIHKMKCP